MNQQLERMPFSKKMRIALAQINATLGDFKKNADKILEYVRRSKERRCDLVVFPEASLFGYHPMDLLERASIVNEQLRVLKQIEKKLPADIGVLLGAFTLNLSAAGKPYHNSAIFLQKGKRPQVFHKELLPTYDVFDEARHIESGRVEKNILKFRNKKILITICEDIWAFPKNSKDRSLYPSNPIKRIKKGSMDFCLNLSASPYFLAKREQRLRVTRAVVKHLGCPMVYVNMVGAQDELIYDGGSFALDRKGNIIAQCLRFEEDLNVVDFKTLEGGLREINYAPAENMRRALVLGIRDYINKIGQKNVHLGLSGGIDSAVVACLAVDALGPERVTAIALPGPFSADMSFDLAKQLSQRLHIRLHSLSIRKLYDQFLRDIDKKLGVEPFGLPQENLQARLRGNILMFYSNKKNSILLNTSNKCELAAGYGTLYGDLAGGLSPIGDLLKEDVYELAKLYNKEIELIPKKIITRAPSAELRPRQKDSDTLPPYERLDRSVVQLVEKRLSPRTKEEKFLLNALMRSEFKRWQSPPILKVREHSFGQGRRMPLAHNAIF